MLAKIEIPKSIACTLLSARLPSGAANAPKNSPKYRFLFQHPNIASAYATEQNTTCSQMLSETSGVGGQDGRLRARTESVEAASTPSLSDTPRLRARGEAGRAELGFNGGTLISRKPGGDGQSLPTSWADRWKAYASSCRLS